MNNNNFNVSYKITSQNNESRIQISNLKSKTPLNLPKLNFDKIVDNDNDIKDSQQIKNFNKQTTKHKFINMEDNEPAHEEEEVLEAKLDRVFLFFNRFFRSKNFLYYLKSMLIIEGFVFITISLSFLFDDLKACKFILK